MTTIPLLGRGGFGATVTYEHLRTVIGRTSTQQTYDNSSVVKIFSQKRHWEDETNKLQHVSSLDIISYYLGSEELKGKFQFIARNSDDSITIMSNSLYCIFMRRLTPITQPITFEKLCSDIYQQLKTMHDNGLYHRDVKPDNIMYDANADAGRYTLIDFGMLAKRLSPTSSIKGTVSYMSPGMIYWYLYNEVKHPTPLKVAQLYDMYVSLHEYLHPYPIHDLPNIIKWRNVSNVSYLSWMTKVSYEEAEIEKYILAKNDEFALGLTLATFFPDHKGGTKGKKSPSASAKALAISSSREQSMANSNSKSSPKTSRNNPKTSCDNSTSSSCVRVILM